MAPKRRRGKITAPLSKESTNSTDNYGINNNNKDDQEENQGIVERKSGNEYNNDPIVKNKKRKTAYKNGEEIKPEKNVEIKAVVNESNGEISCSIEETNRVRILLGLKPLNSSTSTNSADSSSSMVTNKISSSSSYNSNELKASVTEENNEISCSVEETNRIRAQLGLKPLNISSTSNDLRNKSKDEEAIANFQNEQNTVDTIRQEELMRQRIEQARERRLDKQSLLSAANSIPVYSSSTIKGSDDLAALSTIEWVKRSRSIGTASATTAGERTQQSKSQSHSNANDDHNQEHLEGVHIKHDWQTLSSSSSAGELKEGVILTLADQQILKKDEKGNMIEGGVMNPEGDVLHNVNAIEDERRRERRRMHRYAASVNQAGGYSGLDDHEFISGYEDDGENDDDIQDYRYDPRRDVGRGMLAHYDADAKSKEILKKNRMIIGKGGIVADRNSGRSDDVDSNLIQKEIQNQRSNSSIDDITLTGVGKFVDVSTNQNQSRQLSSSDDFLRCDEVKKKKKSTFKKKKKVKDTIEDIKKTTGRVGDKMKEFDTGDNEFEKDKRVADAKEKLKQKLKVKAKGKQKVTLTFNQDSDSGTEKIVSVDKIEHDKSIGVDSGTYNNDIAYEAESEVRVTASEPEIDEDEDAANELLQSIARARRLNQEREAVMDVSTSNYIDNSDNGTTVDNYVLNRVKDLNSFHSSGIHGDHVNDNDNGNDRNKLVFSETSEFATRMRLQQKEKENQKRKEKEMEISHALSEEMKQKSHNVGGHSANATVANDTLTDDATTYETKPASLVIGNEDKNNGKDKNVENNSMPILQGPQVQGSLAAALAMFRTSGGNTDDSIASISATASNKKPVQIIGRANDIRKESSHNVVKNREGLTKEIKVEHRDEHGNLLTKKEAYRQLSYRFHGKGSLPGVKKQEKRRKELKLQQEAKSNSNAGTGTGGSQDYDPLMLQATDVTDTTTINRSNGNNSSNSSNSKSRGAAMMGYIKAAQQITGQAHVSLPGSTAFSSSGLHLPTHDSEMVRQMAVQQVNNRVAHTHTIHTAQTNANANATSK